MIRPKQINVLEMPSQSQDQNQNENSPQNLKSDVYLCSISNLTEFNCFIMENRQKCQSLIQWSLTGFGDSLS